MWGGPPVALVWLSENYAGSGADAKGARPPHILRQKR